MTIGYMIFLGIFLLIALMYVAIGTPPVLLLLWLLLAVVSVIYTFLINSVTTKGVQIKPKDRLKAYRCNWCNRCFWTRKGVVEHENTVHPVQAAKERAYRRSLADRRKHPTKVHNPDDYLKPCTWCGGSGYKNGVMCDECGGTGKMFR